jgi:hypothetical protein
VDRFILGVDDRLQDLGAAIRERLFETRPSPAPAGEDMPDEVFRDRAPARPDDGEASEPQLAERVRDLFFSLGSAEVPTPVLAREGVTTGPAHPDFSPPHALCDAIFGELAGADPRIAGPANPPGREAGENFSPAWKGLLVAALLGGACQPSWKEAWERRKRRS